MGHGQSLHALSVMRTVGLGVPRDYLKVFSGLTTSSVFTFTECLAIKKNVQERSALDGKGKRGSGYGIHSVSLFCFSSITVIDLIKSATLI